MNLLEKNQLTCGNVNAKKPKNRKQPKKLKIEFYPKTHQIFIICLYLPKTNHCAYR